MYGQPLPGGTDSRSCWRWFRFNRFFCAFACTLFLIHLWKYYPKTEVVIIQEVPITTTASITPAPSLIYRGVLDSMDGIGYKFAPLRQIPLDPRYEELNSLEICDFDTEKKEKDTDAIMEKFIECMKPLVGYFRDNFTLIGMKWVEQTEICDKEPLFDQLNVQAFPNLHETKYVILPKCKQHNTVVTLGVGHDTKAEEMLNRTLPDTDFYGADPIIEPNIQLFSSFGGKFFPFAVGRKSGFTKFKILPNQNQRTRKYVWQDVTTIEINYFLKEVLGLSQIDIMWIDIEGGEFEFLDYLHRGSKFDENGITICQFNVEMHPVLRDDNGFEKFLAFFERILEEKRWLVLRPKFTEMGVFRFFFVNMEDKKCLRKFL